MALGRVGPYRYRLSLTALNFREQNKWSLMVTRVGIRCQASPGGVEGSWSAAPTRTFIVYTGKKEEIKWHPSLFSSLKVVQSGVE